MKQAVRGNRSGVVAALQQIGRGCDLPGFPAPASRYLPAVFRPRLSSPSFVPAGMRTISRDRGASSDERSIVGAAQKA